MWPIIAFVIGMMVAWSKDAQVAKETCEERVKHAAAVSLEVNK